MNTNYSEIVRKIVENNPKPANIKIGIYWKATNCIKLYIPSTGAVHELESNGTYSISLSINRLRELYGIEVISPAKKERISSYFRYHNIDGIECMEVGTMSMDCHRYKSENPIREWEFYSCQRGNTYDEPRVFVFKGVGTVYKENGEEYAPESFGKYYNKKFVYYINHMPIDYLDTNRQEINKFAGGDINTVWSFLNFYKNNVPRSASTRVSAALEVCNSAKTEGLNERCKEFKGCESIYIASYDEKYESVLIRHISYRDYGYLANKEPVENIRLVVNKKGVPTVFTQKSGKWCLNSSANIYQEVGKRRNYVMINFDEIYRIESLKYNKDIIDNCEKPIKTILELLRHPIVEKLIKSGFPSIARRITNNSVIKGNLKDLFDVNTEKGSLKSVFGMTTKQMKIIEKKLEEAYVARNELYSRPGTIPIDAIKQIKSLLGVEKISDVDLNTFENYFDVACLMDKHSPARYNSRWIISMKDGETDDNQRYGYYRPRDLNEEEFKKLNKVFKFFIKIKKSGHDLDNSIRTYLDCCNLLRQIAENHVPKIAMYETKDYESLLSIHEDLNQLNSIYPRYTYTYLYKNTMKPTISEEKYKEVQEERINKFEHSNGNWAIVVPKELGEIVTEGQALCHCVGGYTSRVRNNQTNILFLRNVNDIKKPFYTIEVKDNELVQIHGFANKWLGSENNIELIQFVINWLNERNISYKKNILLNKSNSYGGSAECIDAKLFKWK